MPEIFFHRRDASRFACSVVDARKGLRARPLEFIGRTDERLHFVAERIHARVGMSPRIDESGFVERLDQRAHLGKFEQARASGNQQANAELNGRNIFDEIGRREDVEQFEIALKRGPRREGNERGLERESHFARKRDDAEKIGAGVALVETSEDGVVDGLDGAGDEEAAGVAQLWQTRGVLQEVLDLDGNVVSERGKFAMQRLDDGDGVANTVEEVGVAEGNVAGAGGDLLANVSEDDVALDDAEGTVVNRHNRTVSAEMLAAAAGFGIADDAMAFTRHDEMGVLFERRETAAVGDVELLAGEGDGWLWLSIRRWRRGRVAEALDEMDEAFFEFAAENGLDAECSQVVGVHRRVKAVEADVRAWVQTANGLNQRDGEARGGVHGHVKRNEISGANRRFAEVFAGEIEAGDFGTGAVQPSGGRRKAKRLAAKLVGRDENNAHGSVSLCVMAGKRASIHVRDPHAVRPVLLSASYVCAIRERCVSTHLHCPFCLTKTQDDRSTSRNACPWYFPPDTPRAVTTAVSP